MSSSSCSRGLRFYTTFRQGFDPLFSRLLPSLKPRPVNLAGKTAIVTGANVGIGLEVARQLASMGATVILACRSVDKGQNAIADILESGKGNISSSQLEVMALDCSDLDSVSAFVGAWGNRSLDILFNNAGMTPALYEKSPQGFESTYTVNTLSQVFLSLSLLPQMNVGARIVNVTSIASSDVKTLDPQDLDYSNAIEKKFGLKPGERFSTAQMTEVYGVSKLLQIFFTMELQKVLDASTLYAEKGIIVHAYHPGIVKSSIYSREGISEMKALQNIVNVVGVSCDQGAATGIFLATDQRAVANKGCYWDRMALRCPNPLVYNDKIRHLVWEQMVAHCNLEGGLRV